MEQKKINLSLLFSLIIFAIGIAITSISNFFGGFGIPFVAFLVLTSLVFVNGFLNKENRRRLYDIFVFIVIFAIFMSIIFCSVEWAKTYTAELVDFVHVISNFLSVISLVFFIYTLVRYLAELNGTKLVVFEVILGFKKIERKPREKKEKVQKQKVSKSFKEVQNGDLEEKPSADINNEDSLEIKENEETNLEETSSQPTEETKDVENVSDNNQLESEQTNNEPNQDNENSENNDSNSSQSSNSWRW